MLSYTILWGVEIVDMEIGKVVVDMDGWWMRPLPIEDVEIYILDYIGVYQQQYSIQDAGYYGWCAREVICVTFLYPSHSCASIRLCTRYPVLYDSINIIMSILIGILCRNYYFNDDFLLCIQPCRPFMVKIAAINNCDKWGLNMGKLLVLAPPTLLPASWSMA